MENYIIDERTLKSLETELPQMLADKGLADFTVSKKWQNGTMLIIQLNYTGYEYPLLIEYDIDLDILFQDELPELDSRCDGIHLIKDRDTKALLRLLYIIWSSCCQIASNKKDFMHWKHYRYRSMSMQFKDDRQGRLALYGRH